MCASTPPQGQHVSLIPTALTHPEVVEALGQAEMLRRDVGLKVLVETWLQWDEFGQWWEVVHFLCGWDTAQGINLDNPPGLPSWSYMPLPSWLDYL